MQCNADRLRENQRCYTGMLMSHQSSAAFNVTALLRAGRDWILSAPPARRHRTTSLRSAPTFWTTSQFLCSSSRLDGVGRPSSAAVQRVLQQQSACVRRSVHGGAVLVVERFSRSACVDS